MTEEIIIKPEKRYTWEQWQAGRALRRRQGETVAPSVIRRGESSNDKRLRNEFDGKRGPDFVEADGSPRQ